MRKYRYITFADRRQIAARYLSGERVADIAESVGVSAAAVYRELKRGAVIGEDGPVLDRNQRPAYNPVTAQQSVQASIRRRGRTVATAAAGTEA